MRFDEIDDVVRHKVQTIKARGIKPESLTRSDVMILRRICAGQLEDTGSLRLDMGVRFSKDPKRKFHAVQYISSDTFTRRVCFAFGRDGSIVIMPWANMRNLKTILSAIDLWLDLIAPLRGKRLPK